MTRSPKRTSCRSTSTVTRLLRRPGDGLLEPLEVGLGGDQAGDAEHDAVAEEDLAERAADDGADDPAHEGLLGVLARGAAAEVLAADEHRCTRVNCARSAPRSRYNPARWRRVGTATPWP